MVIAGGSIRLARPGITGMISTAQAALLKRLGR